MNELRKQMNERLQAANTQHNGSYQYQWCLANVFEILIQKWCVKVRERQMYIERLRRDSA